MTRTEAIEQSRGPLAMTEANYRKVVAGEKWKTRRGMSPQPPEDMSADCIHCDFYNPVKVDKHGEEYPGKEVYGAYDTFGEWGAAAKYQSGEIYYLPEPVQLINFVSADFRHGEQVTDAMAEGVYLCESYSHPNGFQINISDKDYKAIADRKGPKNWKGPAWKAPTTARFMRKCFAREFVRIKSVKVERLQDITPEDCVAEGVTHPLGNLPQSMGWVRSRMEKEILESFQKLWNSIHGPDAWDANPYIFVYEFERLEVAK